MVFFTAKSTLSTFQGLWNDRFQAKWFPSSFRQTKTTMSEQCVFLCYLIITTDTQTQTSPNHLQSLWKLYHVRQCLRKSTKSGCESCMSLRRMWSATYAHSTSVEKGYLHSDARDSRDFSWKTQRRGQRVWQDLIPTLSGYVHAQYFYKQVRDGCNHQTKFLYSPHILGNSFESICWEMQNKPV